jgi:glucose dehydrogenase
VLRGHEGGPLVIGDVMYVHTPFPNKVFALDLNDDGKIIWKYEPRQDSSVIPVMCCDTVNRGVAYGDGKIFLHQADTTLVALDAKTGEALVGVQRRPEQGRDRHRHADGGQGQGLSSVSPAVSSACAVT